MVMKITKKELENIKKSVDKLVKQGSTIEYAVSAIASQNNINMGQLMKVLYPKSENNYKNEYKDIKTSVGTYAVLKSNPNIRYEVIKINNKEDIKLRDLMTNKIIKAKEEEILPIVTENNMKKNLKEANYNLSIDGLETIDADKLSQILTLAGEAEGNVTDTTFEPEVDMSDMDLNAYANPEYDTAVVPTDSLDDMDTTFDTDMSFEQEPTLDDEFGYEDYEQFPVTESKMDEDVLLDPQSDDETYNAQKKDVETDELLSEDDLETSGVNQDDWSNGIDDNLEETEDLTIDEPIMEDEMEMDEESNEKIEEEIAECLKLAGVELNEVSEEKATKGKKDLPQVVGHKTAFSKSKQNGFKPGENQRPDYKCVRTKDVMGKESSEGFKEPMNVSKVCCNESKIKSICETASRMYAKKDHSEWLALDRRYVEKLLNEGIGYERASKMLLKAKGGK